jgi:hypothetical protein
MRTGKISGEFTAHYLVMGAPALAVNGALAI